MKVVALLSGGKDSCFNLMEAVANGHELVAVAGLLPEQGIDELDSFMFQTVGLNHLPLIAQSLRLPLYTRTITGTAVNVAGEYGDRKGVADSGGGTAGDETEDLWELLKEVKENHPDVQGVAVGAILSSYQRVRVEHVCARLGLTALAFLWQRNQASLLASMVSSGLTAVLIKVAGVGLDEHDLGKTLGQMQGKLTKLNSMYGLHICGEGGEYETLTLDCPLFHDRVQLDQLQPIITDSSPVAQVAHLRIVAASLVPKPNHIVPSPAEMRALLGRDEVEEYLDEEAEEVRDVVLEVRPEGGVASTSRVEVAMGKLEEAEMGVTVGRKGKWVAVGGVTGYNEVKSRKGKERAGFETLEEEVTECFWNLRETLLSLSPTPLPLTSISTISLFLSSMDLFPAVNAIYKTFFGTSPPTRACVAVPLPNGERVRLEAVAFDGEERERKALHVQSLSYWAPANIGPYSQSVIVGERTSLAGQIALIPSTLSLPTPSSFATETALSLKHVRSIVKALKEGTGGGWESEFVEGCIGWTNPSAPFSITTSSSHLPPTLFLAPSSLPKACLVEWQVSLHTGRSPNPIEPVYTDDDEDPEMKPPTWERVDAGTIGEWEEGVFEEGEARWGIGVWEGVGESTF
ncbi:hypothetical protein BDY24DRAFT_343422 [Mrakia frigida]|uniref:diphthine--ammonia ligase n=1 Tax=Mrakia frigida TaxID=29902 RepID=UPI003FCBF410